jgi:hypothetical protein
VFARLTTTVIGVNEREAAAEIVEGILPTLKGLEGFKGVLVLADEKTRVIYGMTLWESAEAMERSESVMKVIRQAETNSRDVVRSRTRTGSPLST